MIQGISFGRGVFFHDRHVLACAEVKNGTIHLWAETITPMTIFKMWLRVIFSLPWYYNVFHAGLIAYFLLTSGVFPAADLPFALPELDPYWAFVYLAGFHFVFPARLKKFHGAEHKVFSYAGVKKVGAWQEIGKADIVNQGCSTNLVTCFFLLFLLVFPVAPLEISVWAGAAGILIGFLGDRVLRRYLPFIYRLSAMLQRYVTTKEPDRIHLETAIRSYLLFLHQRDQAAQVKAA